MSYIILYYVNCTILRLNLYAFIKSFGNKMANIRNYVCIVYTQPNTIYLQFTLLHELEVISTKYSHLCP